MANSVNSLNASAAGAIVFYEALRQKLNKKTG
jgi:tRNA G18 (ribose-2'-O)-methylase SpoU